MNVVKFEVWGDSILDDQAGIGARTALAYENHFRHDVEMTRNNAKAGSTVSMWIEEFLTQPMNFDVVVVSSGFNEGVSIAYGFMTIEDVRNNWQLLTQAVKNNGKKILWVPTQFQWGLAPEFKTLEELHVTPVCLGADLLAWQPTVDQVCPDGVHPTYSASQALAQMIMDRVAEYGKPTDAQLKFEKMDQSV